MKALARLFELRKLADGRPTSSDWIELAFFAAVLVVCVVTVPDGAHGEPNAPLQSFFRDSTGGGVCVYRRVTGIECPGCGLTRGFVQIAHGRPLASLKLNPFAPVLFALVSFRFAGMAAVCLLRREIVNKVPWSIAWRFYGALAAGFVALGLFRVVASIAR